MVLRTSRMRWFGHVERSAGWIAKLRKLNVVAQKRPGRPKKTWDEVLMDDRKKLGMDSADPQNCSEWRGRLRERLVKQAQPSVEENRFKMMMMMIDKAINEVFRLLQEEVCPKMGMYNLGTCTGGPRDLRPGPLEDQGYYLGTYYRRATALISHIMAIITDDNY